MKQTTLKTSVVFALVAALALVAVVPAVGMCEGPGSKCGTDQCCGACCQRLDDAASTCCSTPAPPRVCRCCGDTRPDAPSQERTSDDRNDLVRAETGIVYCIGGQAVPSKLFGDTSLTLLSKPLQVQAVLCCWLN